MASWNNVVAPIVQGLWYVDYKLVWSNRSTLTANLCLKLFYKGGWRSGEGVKVSEAT